MSFADSVANDYKMFDAVETVTYAAVRAAGSTDYSVTHAEPYDHTTEEVVASEGLFSHGDRQWSLGCNQLSGVVPQAGDKITQSDGTVWVLFAAAVKDSLGITWVCQTRKAR